MMTFAVTYILDGVNKRVCVIKATDRDDAYDKARAELVSRRWYSASIQGTARPASQEDINAAAIDTP